ncbi:MAG: hypothetical protein ACYSOZ_05940, partial [Planctomycetota bacterium]
MDALDSDRLSPQHSRRIFRKIRDDDNSAAQTGTPGLLCSLDDHVSRQLLNKPFKLQTDNRGV